jgi:hypothetical protein
LHRQRAGPAGGAARRFLILIVHAAVSGARRAFIAFLSEVDTGSREENASKQESRAPFRFHRNGKGSSRTRRTLLTPCWQQAFDRKGAGKLSGFRLRFERK